MPDELRAKPDQIARLGKVTLEASTGLADRQQIAQSDLMLPAAAFGRFAGAEVTQGHADLTASADNAVGALVGVYDGDADKIYGAAASYQRTDDESSHWFDKLNPTHWF